MYYSLNGISTSTVYFKSSDRYIDFADQSIYWRSGGWAVLLSIAGAALAILFGVVIWPVTGKGALRKELAKAYKDMKLQAEGLLVSGYGKYLERKIIPTKSIQISHLVAVEVDIAVRLHPRADRLLDLARLEKFEWLYYDASAKEYGVALDNSRCLWRSLWKLHHVGDIITYMLQREGETMNPATARELLGWHRGVISCYHMFSLALESSDRSSFPVLR